MLKQYLVQTVLVDWSEKLIERQSIFSERKSKKEEMSRAHLLGLYVLQSDHSHGAEESDDHSHHYAEEPPHHRSMMTRRCIDVNQKSIMRDELLAFPRIGAPQRSHGTTSTSFLNTVKYEKAVEAIHKAGTKLKSIKKDWHLIKGALYYCGSQCVLTSCYRAVLWLLWSVSEVFGHVKLRGRGQLFFTPRRLDTFIIICATHSLTFFTEKNSEYLADRKITQNPVFNSELTTTIGEVKDVEHDMEVTLEDFAKRMKDIKNLANRS